MSIQLYNWSCDHSYTINANSNEYLHLAVSFADLTWNANCWYSVSWYSVKQWAACSYYTTLHVKPWRGLFHIPTPKATYLWISLSSFPFMHLILLPPPYLTPALSTRDVCLTCMPFIISHMVPNLFTKFLLVSAMLFRPPNIYWKKSKFLLIKAFTSQKPSSSVIISHGAAEMAHRHEQKWGFARMGQPITYNSNSRLFWAHQFNNMFRRSRRGPQT